jgi:hypothetical protein
MDARPDRENVGVDGQTMWIAATTQRGWQTYDANGEPHPERMHDHLH